MKGYRTLIFAAVIAVAGIFGHHLAPDVVNSWLDAIFALMAVGIATLRWITSTPIGKALPPQVAEVANEIIATAAKADPALVDGGDLAPPADAPASGGATPTGPPDLVSLATSIAGTLKTIQAVHDQVAAQLASAHEAVTAAVPPGIAPVSAPQASGTPANGALTAPAAQPQPAQPAPAQA